MLKAILFDLDGTLLDTAPEFSHALNQLRQERGLSPVSLDLIRPAVSHGSAEVIKVGFNLSDTHPDFAPLKKQFLAIYQKNLGQNTAYFPGIEDLLLKIEAYGLKWGIVTNKPEFLTLPLLAHFKLNKRVHTVVSGDTLSVSKPDPLPILHACAQMSLAPHSCYYVGDAQKDIMAGKAAGVMATFMALYGYLGPQDQPYQWGADHYIHAPKDILPSA